MDFSSVARASFRLRVGQTRIAVMGRVPQGNASQVNIAIAELGRPSFQQFRMHSLRMRCSN
jgi:hypothetical protein